MGKWTASMPKAQPDAGKAHVVFAFKTEKKLRAEFVGQLTDAMTGRLFLDICRGERPVGQDEGIAQAFARPTEQKEGA